MTLTRKKNFRFALAISIFFAACALFSSPRAHSQTESDQPAETEKKAKKVTDFKKLKNPMTYEKKSITRGRTIFVRMCAECHGPDGKALIDLIADATDLTRPKFWRNGKTEGEIFQSIRDGAGEAMPPYKEQIRDEKDIWHLVNFVQSLWPKSVRPKLPEEKKDGGTRQESE